ncbi:MAG: amino acid ABC transporter substrate-binding protein [Desulfobacterales bacterium]|nr:amino acid ABC transporter substrate-binding protein [Desulfobacterales bacterium]
MINYLKNQKLIFYQFIILAFITLFVSSAYSEPIRKLTMGWEPWDPYQYEDEKKEVKGLDIELIDAIVKNMHCELVLKQMPWKRELNEVKDGNIDLAAGASKTPEREEFAYFSAPYRTESAVMFVRKGEANKYNFLKLEDIMESSFSLGVVNGYYYGEKYTELIKNSNFNKKLDIVANDSFNFKKLMVNRIDGFLVDKISGIARLRKEGILDKVEMHSLPIYSSEICVMFSKKSTKPEEVTAFNKSLDELKANGTYDKILNKYLR